MHTGPNENHILLRGWAEAVPAYSHQSHGAEYRSFRLHVPRLSGAEDVLEILAPASLLEVWSPGKGDWLEVSGEVRSFNNRSGTGRRLVISVLARSLSPAEEELGINDLTLSGTLCKAPVCRRTPLGRDICDLLLAVNRRYGRADYLPCIAWGSLALSTSRLSVGDGVDLSGRLQSRLYHKEENGVQVPHTAYEVSIMSLSP